VAQPYATTLGESLHRARSRHGSAIGTVARWRVAMKRRAFLQSSVATVTTWGIAACSDDPGPPEPRDAVTDRSFFPQSVASGDPKPGSVILWTRLEDPAVATDAVLELEVFADPDMLEPYAFGSGRYEVDAQAAFDRCVKVRLEGLPPQTTIWYRFVYRTANDIFVASPLGRTKTAPLPDADVPVRFAFVSCQDFIGRYYNAYAHMAEQTLDFFVHLGDYVYETTGDPQFQNPGDTRSIVFGDTAGALTLGEGDGVYQAARSLDNYRQLYRTVRQDPALARVHERIPMIAIWDDHEFSDDCHGATATYLDGRSDETDLERRQNANQAWFEYMPVDYVAPEFVYDRAFVPPDDIAIHRDFLFGRHLHLVMTDLRSRRPDHLIAEDAYPGTVLADQTALELTGGVPAYAAPYIPDIDGFAGGVYAAVLRAAAVAESYPPERIVGPISAGWLGAVIEAIGNPDLPPLDEAVVASLPRGIAVFDLGKTSLYGSLGSRYAVATAAFGRYSQIVYADTAGASENLMGDAQLQWFRSVIAGSTATWRVWGNEFCLTPLVLDLSAFPGVPALLQRPLTLNAEDWNGAPNLRSLVIAELADKGNVIALTGDIHSFLAATPMTLDGTRKIVEFVTGSVSSSNYASIIEGLVKSDPAIAGIPGLDLLLQALPGLLSGPNSTNAALGFADLENHGYAIVDVGVSELRTTYFVHPRALVEAPYYDDPGLAAMFTAVEFRVVSGSQDLQMRSGDQWLTWDPTLRMFVLPLV